MSCLNYYIIDTETTGVKSSWHEITEIGVIRCVDRVQLHRCVKCDYPERANVDSLRITNKTLKDIVQGSSKQDVVDEVNKLLTEDNLTPDHRCIVAHNAAFDRRFLYALWEEVGQTFPANLFLDTIALTNDFIKKTDTSKLTLAKTATGRISKKLSDACDMVGVKRVAGVSHSAKIDSRNNYLLWKKLVDDHKIDYLPHIKTFAHSFTPETSVENMLKALDDEDGADGAQY